jgi:outer membrane protein OmpA-like peptidoglycan-associated protein
VAGSPGPTGPSGVAGVQGPTGPVGATGPVGVVERWTSFRDILFDFDRTNIRSSETSKVSEVVAYMRQNPSLQVGLDGYANPRSTDPNAQTMRDRRVGVVRDALIQAGVPDDKIRTGAFGEGRLTCNDSTEACQQHDRRVEVLIRTGN